MAGYTILILVAAMTTLAHGKMMEKATMEMKKMDMGSDKAKDMSMGMDKDKTVPLSNAVKFHDYCIIGAGPAGLQLGYFMEKAGRDYIIYERNNVSGSFFVRYPRHRKLISINKVHTGRTNNHFNERHDWNSLLSDDDSLLFKHYSQEFFPNTDPLLEYLEDYRRKLNIKVQFNTQVQNLRRVKDGERSDGYNFVMNDQNGNFMVCRVAIVATGMGKANKVSFKGSEYVEDYSDFERDQQKYAGKTVLILGRGNSAFETADEIYQVANTVHMVSRNRVRLSWNTHYVGDLRGLNNNMLDTYQLKSLDGLLEFDVNRLGLMKRNGKLYASVHWGDEYNDTTLYPRVKPENEDNFANFPFRLPYDHVISCLGWKFDGSLLHLDTQQLPHGKVAKYPAIRYDYQSWITRDLYFAGTNSHSVDWRKAAGGFIHGFRYTAKALHKILEYRYHGVPWPSQTYDNTQMLNVLVKRLNEAPGPYQMVSFLADVVILKENTFTLLEEFPVKLLPHFSDITGHTGSKYFVIINEYGPGFSGPDVDTLGPDRASTGGAMEAHKSNFLHPVIYYYEGMLPTEEQFSELPTETWKFVLPRPKKVHHVVEDFLSMWTASSVHILPLRRFLDDVLGQDMRLYFNTHCFELGLNFANVPAGCKAYLEGKGLSLSNKDVLDIVNYLHGTTTKKSPMDHLNAKCEMEDHPLNHNNLNRTDFLHQRLRHFYPTKDINSQFPHDFVNEEEELEGFRFIYEDTVPEALLEDDEVRSVWRWSRSVIAHQSVDYPFTTLTEKNFETVLAAHSYGIVQFGLHFDPVSRSVEEMLNGLVAEFAQSKIMKKPLIGHLNCYDWPKVCEKLMIKEYPTVKLLHNGNLRPYTGILEKSALLSAVKLCALDFPVRLNSIKEVDQFLSDKHMAQLGVDSAVVLSMPHLYSADSMSFTFLESHFGKRPIAICCNNTLAHDAFYQKHGRNLGLMNPRKESWAVVAHATDSYVPHNTHSFSLPPQKTIGNFLEEASLPIFGELDWRTLPAYYRSGKDLIMLFGTESQRRISGSVMANLALMSKDKNIQFVYVNSETPGVYVYTKDGGHVVALSQKENMAYWYSGDTISSKNLQKWIVDFKIKKLAAAAERPQVDWPPAAKPYDFLAMIDAEEAVKTKQENLARQVVRLSKAGILNLESSTDMKSMESKANATSSNTSRTVSSGISASGQYAADIQQQSGSTSGILLDSEACLKGQCESDSISYGTYSHGTPKF